MKWGWREGVGLEGAESKEGRYRIDNRECFAFFISAGRAFFFNSKELGVLLARYG